MTKGTQILFDFTTPKKTKKMGKIIKMKVKKVTKTTTKAKTNALKKLPAKLKGKATLAQLNRARKTGASVSISSKPKRQTGSSTKSADKLKKAIAPGKRLTAAGNIYYESRKNRSDKAGSNI